MDILPPPFFTESQLESVAFVSFLQHYKMSFQRWYNFLRKPPGIRSQILWPVHVLLLSKPHVPLSSHNYCPLTLSEQTERSFSMMILLSPFQFGCKIFGSGWRKIVSRRNILWQSLHHPWPIGLEVRYTPLDLLYSILVSSRFHDQSRLAFCTNLQ